MTNINVVLRMFVNVTSLYHVEHVLYLNNMGVISETGTEV